MHFAEGFVAGAVAAGAAAFIYHRYVLREVKGLISLSELSGKELDLAVKLRLERWLGVIEGKIRKVA
ncbi:MAG: hypothetical protein DMG22_21445 [Acidobacteria bacterium]|nr:MAG: hypothetical protein DMG22_21445 [Acidobacteriota bacterium]